MFELDLDFTSALAGPARCPTCTSDRLTPVARDGVVTFRCRDCRGAWAFELGAMLPRMLPSPEGPERRQVPPPRRPRGGPDGS
ncbi:MAG TPA: zf-TFIIB domain-containing protein [Marmoricola sp.]|nr:zf-TFIIB domain-containing protein [Marmoricola sp.]